MDALFQAAAGAYDDATTGDLIALVGIVFAAVYGTIFARWASRPWEKAHIRPEVARAKREHRQPDPAAEYPTGWYVVCRGAELPARGVKDVVFCGRRVAVWRGTDGKARAVDAYCAHLGANMGHGDVVGNHLRCPFHHWVYNGEGKVTSVPYAKPKCIPSEARVDSWHVLEQDDQIMLWYAARAGQEPHWRPKVCNPTGMPYRGNFSVDIRGRVRSVTENSADVAHFQFVHANTWSGWLRSIFHSRWRLTAPYRTDGPFATIAVDSIIVLFNTFTVAIPLKVTQLGPGIANISATLPAGAGKAEIIQCALPGARPDHTTLTERVYGESWLARFIVYFAMQEVLQDSTIWSEQKAQDRPVLATVNEGEETSDAIIAKYRVWFSQFEGAKVPPPKSDAADGEYAAEHDDERSPDYDW